MKPFWDCNNVPFDDLPTVGELIEIADWDLLAHEIARSLPGNRPASEQASIQTSLEDMMCLKQREPSAKWVFFPVEVFSTSDCAEHIEWQLDAALLRRSDFPTIERLHDQEQLLYSAKDCLQAQRQACDRFGERYPDLHSWAHRPWPKLLSYRVWLHGPYSRKERYRVLAAIVEEMLTYGSTWDEVREARKLMRLAWKSAAPSRTCPHDISSLAALLQRDFGLQSSTDDYTREFERRQDDLARVLNHNATVDLHRRVVDFMRRTRRVEKSALQLDPVQARTHY